jgi:DNA-directed RNA polymerase specialized sigma24 family protein
MHQESRLKSLGDLLAEMRHGDRDAAAELMRRYGDRLKRRVRGKLSSPVRRVFDSHDIFSTVGRRLDLYVSNGSFFARSEAELWALLARMIDHAVVDKARITQRYQRVEGDDAVVAQALLKQLESSGRDQELTIHQIDQLLGDDGDLINREILLLWSREFTFEQIAEMMGVDAAMVRQRWRRLRAHLREQLDDAA